MAYRQCLDLYSIKCAVIPFVNYVRYFTKSSFYLAFGVGILELVARFKDILCKIPNENIYSIKIALFKDFFFKNSERFENLILKISAHIAKNLKNSKQAFKLINYHFGPEFLYNIETDFRELFYSILSSEDSQLSELIRSGVNPINHMPAVLTKLSNTFGISITFCNFESDTLKFNPLEFDQCPKFFLLYNKADYSIGYNESMYKLDKNFSLVGTKINELIKTSKERIILKLTNTVEELIKTHKKEGTLDQKVVMLLKDLNGDIKSSVIQEYFSLANSELKLPCVKCGSMHSSTEYIKSKCTAGCNVCINCLKMDYKRCPKCGEMHKKNIEDEINRRIAAKELKN